MRRPTASCLLLLLASCGARITGNASLDGTDAAVDPDAAVITDALGDALTLGPWSPPAPVTVAATSAAEDDVTLSSTALELIFAIAVGTTGKDLYYTSRAAPGAAWAPIAKLPFDTASSEETPRFSGDDKTLYFASDRGTSGSLDIYSVTRTTVGSNATWDKPKLVAGINTTAVEKWFAPCTGGHYVVVQSTAANGTDLLEGTLAAGAPTPIGVLNSASNETSAFLTQDCLTLYFASNRSTATRIYVAHRAAIAAPWQPPAVVNEFKIGGGTDNQEDPAMSADGRTFVFASNAAGTLDIYISTR